MRLLIRITALLFIAAFGMGQVYEGGGGCSGCGGDGALIAPTVAEMREALLEGNPYGMACGETWTTVTLPACAGGSASYNIVGLPEWLAFTASSRELSATNTPLSADASTVVQITYVCSNGSSSDSVVLSVNDLDGDTVSDCLEYIHGAVPLVNNVFGWIALTPGNEPTYRTAVIERIPTALVVTTDAMNALNPADAAEDFDGDGITNAAEISAGTNIFVAASGGQLALESQVEFGEAALFITVGDFNEDGALDIALTVVTPPATTATDVMIALGNGDGTFTAGTSVSGVGSELSTIAAADINNDGHLDIVVLDSDDALPPQFVPLLGDGAGGFTVGTAVRAGVEPIGLLAADFSNDNNVDVFVTDLTGDAALIRLGNGSGGFSGSGSFSAGTQPFLATAADFDADNALDVALLNENGGALPGTLRVLGGNGAGSFSIMATRSIGVASWWVAAGDVNNDGDQDIVQSNAGSDSIQVFLGDGAGAFLLHDSMAMTGPGSTILADFDGDGDLDIISGGLGTGDIELFLNAGDGTYDDGTVMANISIPTTLAAGDFNGDGKMDLAVTLNGPAGELAILLNQ